MAFDAFISYSSKDKVAADATCAVLEAAGVRCWIAPRDIHAGSEYGAAIIDAIDHCHVMILVFSSSANESRQIHREIERAVTKGIPILPVRIEEVAPTKSMEYFLGAIHWLDALNPPLEQHLQQLAGTVKAMLKMDADPQVRPDARPDIRPASDAAHKDDAAKPFVAKALGVEVPTQRAEPAKRPAAAFGLLNAKIARPNWPLSAIGGAALVALVALVAGGVWLFRAKAPTPTATATSTPSPPVQPAHTTLRAAAQAHDFLIGSTVKANWLRNDALYSQTLAHEYNAVMPEVETRFYLVHPSRTEFNFADLDAIVEFAAVHGIKVLGQGLVWDGQLPQWLTGGNFSPNELSAILKEYIQTMLRRYRGRIYSWDLAWGVFDNLGAMRQQTFWAKAIGADYLEQAAAWAREADPQLKLFLYYNYALDPLGAASDATYDQARKFKIRGVPIDGVAIAAPSLLDRLPKMQDVTANMNRLAALDLELHVDTFEISVAMPPSEADLQRQAVAYGDYLSTCLSIANCKGFLTYGFADKDAWAPNRWKDMGVGAAMPFDASYKPKPAYKAMLDALKVRQSAIR